MARENVTSGHSDISISGSRKGQLRVEMPMAALELTDGRFFITFTRKELEELMASGFEKFLTEALFG
jgi:hypothetical protein